MGREHHGTNCAYRADPDEPCTCGVTERTEREMHAAWRKRAEEAETALAAMTAERDSLKDAVHFLNTMNDEQDEWFTRIADDHGGWHEDLPTGEAHIEEIIGNLKKERDARDVAIRVLAKACANLSGLCNCESWCPARTDGKACTCGNEMEHAAIIQTINANPIARAAVEGER